MSANLVPQRHNYVVCWWGLPNKKLYKVKKTDRDVCEEFPINRGPFVKGGVLVGLRLVGGGPDTKKDIYDYGS